MNKFLIAALIVVGVLFTAAFTAFFYLGPNSTVFVANTSGGELELFVDGDSTATLAPGESDVLALRAGKSYSIEARGSNGPVHEGSFQVPERETGDERYKALYVVGPSSDFAVVTARYREAPNFLDPIQQPFNAEPGELIPLPSEVETDGIDEPFPLEVRSSDDNPTVVHLCTWNPVNRRNGCDN